MPLEKWHPFKDWEIMRREMEKLWDEFSLGPRGFHLGLPWKRDFEHGIGVSTVDVIDKKDEILVKAEMPGVDKDKVDLSVEEGRLAIEAEIKKEEEIKEENYYHRERSFQSFSRLIELPTRVDASKVKASYKDGILAIHLPKVEEVKAKKVKIDIG